jgi:hypothetical protein
VGKTAEERDRCFAWLREHAPISRHKPPEDLLGLPDLGEMLRVIPDIEAGEPELLRSAFVHGVKRMPCTFRARA